MVFSAEEEIYITVVMVKRPASVVRPDLAPGQWAQTILDALSAQGMESKIYTLEKARLKGAVTSPERLEGIPRQQRISLTPTGHLPALLRGRSGWFLCLSFLCFAGSAYFVHLLVK